MKDSLKELKQRRDELNLKVKELLVAIRSERDRLKSTNETIDKLKQERDGKNRMASNLVTKRKSIEDKINECKKEMKQYTQESAKYEVIPKDPARLKEAIKKLDWDIQTRQHTVKQDEKMRERLEELEESLMLSKERTKIDRILGTSHAKLNRYREELELTDELIIDTRQSARKFHEELLPLYSKIKDLRTSLAPQFRQIKDLKKEADTAHETYIAAMKKVRESRENKLIEDKKRFESEKSRAENELKKKAQDLFRQFTQGKKLTSEELTIIQKYGK